MCSDRRWPWRGSRPENGARPCSTALEDFGRVWFMPSPCHSSPRLTSDPLMFGSCRTCAELVWFMTVDPLVFGSSPRFWFIWDTNTRRSSGGRFHRRVSGATASSAAFIGMNQTVFYTFIGTNQMVFYTFIGATASSAAFVGTNQMRYGILHVYNVRRCD